MNEQTTLWQPTEEFIQQSNLKAFERWLEKRQGRTYADYDALWNWSTEEPADFWRKVAEYFEVNFNAPPQETLRGEMPAAEWFAGATLNYAEHLFRYRKDHRPALVFASETIDRQEIEWADLEAQVKQLKDQLTAAGIGLGDRVAGYLPNTPEAVVAFLAVNALGAVWSCCSPDFGLSTVLDRFSQIEPKLLIAVDGYRYGGKPFDRRDQVLAIRDGIESIETLIWIPYLAGEGSEVPDGAIPWSDVLAKNTTDAPLAFTPVPFSHPIWVLYSSGTTGKPKAITHSHGGVLLEHMKYLSFHNDVKPGEHFFWFSTTGWMMWNFLVASMLVGGIPVLYDGSPGYPNLNRLWKLAADLPIHHFGTSAPFLTACMQRELKPGNEFDFSELRSIGSTGAPLPPEAFDWVYESVSSTVWLCSMSGGTDVCTAFVGGNPYAPVYRGAIQCRGLGCKLKAYDEQGEEVIGSLGEMVIEAPLPSMPIYFWNDPDGRRYRDSYFGTYPGVWRHGDWIKIYPNGSLVIYGRSDATLNRKGVRIGTAEVYAILNSIDAIEDSMILNLELPDGGDRMPLFVVLRAGATLTDELRQQINSELRRQGSPRHVPDEIVAVPGIPYTLSGKKMEVPVKKILMGMSGPGSVNPDTVRNPEALAFFFERADR